MSRGLGLITWWWWWWGGGAGRRRAQGVFGERGGLEDMERRSHSDLASVEGRLDGAWLLDGKKRGEHGKRAPPVAPEHARIWRTHLGEKCQALPQRWPITAQYLQRGSWRESSFSWLSGPSCE
jgi:hypothetical protein